MLASLLPSFALAALAWGDGHVVEAPRSPEAAAEWIAVAPRTLAGALEPLAEHRTRQGLRAAIVPIEAIREEFKAGTALESVRAFVADAAGRGGGRFLLLVGDAEVLPPERREGFFKKRFASDAAYSTASDGSALDCAVGRFPTADPAAVRSLVERTIAYESDRRPGGWRRRIAFLAASGGFGEVIDRALEAAVAGLLDRELPAEFDLRVLRPDPESQFGVPAAKEGEAVADLWNAGALIGLYAGHGSRVGLHTATKTGFTRTVFGSGDAARIAVRNGAPFLVFFACNTGEFDSPKGCLATALLQRPAGAIAVLAASQISHPYGDMLLAHELNGVFRGAPEKTVGEMAREARARVAAGSEFRDQVDRFAGMLGISETERAEIVRYETALYNLFGDPALRLRRPEAKTTLAAPRSAAAGAEIELEVACEAPDGAQVLITLETPRGVSPPKGVAYPASNDRVLAREAGALASGRFRGKLTIPATVRSPRLVVVADVRAPQTQGAAAATIAVTPAAPASPREPAATQPASYR